MLFNKIRNAMDERQEGGDQRAIELLNAKVVKVVHSVSDEVGISMLPLKLLKHPNVHIVWSGKCRPTSKYDVKHVRVRY